MNKKIIFLIFLIFTTCSSIANETKSSEKKEIEKNISEKNTNSEETFNVIEKSEQKNIYLNFENTELSNFINYIAELKKINLIPDKTIENVKVSLTIREPLTVDGAWNVFLTVLEMSGFSIIKVGNVNIVIPKKDKYKQPLPAFINIPVDALPSSDINIRYVTFLENIDVLTIQSLLQSMLNQSDIIIPYPEVNGLIITGKSYNIKSAMKVIRALDQTGLQESVVIIKLKNINAKDAKELFDSLITKEGSSSPLARLLGRQAETTLQYFSPTTRIIAEERSNSLILLGNKNSIAKIENFIINNLDKELKGTISPLHIYELQHTDAEQIKTILETVTDTSAIGEDKSKYGAVRGGVKYFKEMKFEVDKDGNRLIVSSTDKQDWSLLKKTIKDLDKPQPQIALEALFVSIDITEDKSLGGSIRNKKSGQIGKHINFQSPSATGAIVKGTTGGDYQNLLGNLLDGVTGGLGSTILSFGPDANIWGIFKALKTQSNTSVLAQPFICVTNKTKAHLESGRTLNVVNERTSDEDSSFSGYKEIEALTTIDVTPQINTDGIIRLDIQISIDEFTNETLGNKDKKTIETNLSVADGQVIALGGFIKSKTIENIKKTPILGDIPILGWFFKHKSRSISKNYLFIFLSPTIIKPRQTPGINLYTRMKLHQAKKNIDAASESRKSKDIINNWFFNPEAKKYSQKVIDFANARYQPTTVDIKNDPYYGVGDYWLRDEDENKNLQAKNEKNTKKKLIAKTKPKNLNKSTKTLRKLKRRRQA